MHEPTEDSINPHRRVDTEPIAGLDWSEALASAIAGIRDYAYSVNTLKTYDIGYRNWARWASDHGVQVFPAKPEHLEMWLVSLAHEDKTPSTRRTYLAGVAHHHLEHDGPNPAHDLRVRLLLRGLARNAATGGYTPKQAAPLRWCHIQRIADTAHRPRNNQPGGRAENADQARQRADVDIAMVAVAHDAALRCCELLALRWADIEPAQTNQCGTVTIRRSKTDQDGQGAVVPISAFASQALARLRPHNPIPDQHIFDLSPSTLNRRIKTAARTAGIDAEHISSHSPRIGMAHDLAAHGASMHGLTQAGRWKNPATAAYYARRLTAHHTEAAKYLKTQQPTPQTTRTTPPQQPRPPGR